GGHGGGFGGGAHMGGGFGGGHMGGAHMGGFGGARMGGLAAGARMAGGSAEAISPVAARLSVAALRVSMPRCAATSAAITFIAADASGLVAAMTTGATSTPITHRTAICMGTDVPRRPTSRCAA